MFRFCLPWFSILLLQPHWLAGQPIEFEPSPSEDAPATGPSALELTERYWIVSSRNCPQELSQMRNCRLDVWSVDSPRLTNAAAGAGSPPQARRCESREAVFRQVLTLGVPVCVFIHGSYISREKLLRYSQRTWHWLRQAHPQQPLHFIFYTWPSDPITYVPQADFNELGDRAGVNGFYLARVLHQIPAESPVSLIGHSQGAAAAAATVHLLGGGQLEGYRLPPEADRGHRIRLVLAAAAIDQQWLNPGERYGQALSRSEALLNLVNRRDWALGFYHLRSMGSGRAVSRFGFRPTDYLRMGPLSQKIRQMDVTSAVGRGHTWPIYYTRPSLAHSIADYVYFTEGRVHQPIKVLTPPESSQTRFAGGGETFQRAVSK